ncbi:hypothetical protein F0562_000736 [Nyssa sinensis]|uniref:Uncharacterized protein n=1 Tax=Nyssa sinensis TaxID=561372 RepID=A0A5J5C591_9ASTE|nr:hypothetical protein F0562_000736 [Nyssa sinensis]
MSHCCSEPHPSLSGTATALDLQADCSSEPPTTPTSFSLFLLRHFLSLFLGSPNPIYSLLHHRNILSTRLPFTQFGASIMQGFIINATTENFHREETFNDVFFRRFHISMGSFWRINVTCSS